MTAEVAIINKHAIALAADSAVTIGREKVWKTANKLFSLGPRHDIAIMVYGAGDYLGLAWELIVKEFRRRVTQTEFRTVGECAAAFKSFLQSGELFTRADAQEHTVLFPIFDIIAAITEEAPPGGISADDFIAAIGLHREKVQQQEKCITNIDPDKFKATFTDELHRFVEANASKDVADKAKDEVVGLAIDFFCSKFPSRYNSGVVVAGFGSDEFFPALSHHIVDGCWNGSIRCWDGDNCKNLNTTDHYDEFPIVPFAQDDMAFQFMAGISPDYLTFIRTSLEKVMAGAFDDLAEEFVAPNDKVAAKARGMDLANRLVSSVMNGLYKKVREEQFLPVNQAVSALPKEEMAMMAESLVDLASLKRKVDSPLETVGGPVDVAVISKGDGFVWIKRKHYFDPAKNGDFFARKQRRDVGGAV